MKRIVLTGGGTAGHVTPNLALVPELKERGYEILYIGSIGGIERELAEKAGLDYRPIHSGKLRRYFDLKNLSDPFRVIKGGHEARRILREFRPDVIFSKGGFVAVPVTLAAHRLRIPVVSHESDMTPGLANRISAPFATRICCNFPETAALLPKEKAVLTGSPIRRELLSGSRERGLEYCGLTGERPVLLVIGGSLGAECLNRAVREALSRLLGQFEIIHICGKGHLDPQLAEIPGYCQREYISDELKDVFAAADLVLSRAGANAICELLTLRKPNLLVPLSAKASRGDQILNAESFRKQGYSMVIEEEALDAEKLPEELLSLWNSRGTYLAAMNSSDQADAVSSVIGVIEEVLEHRKNL